jgi:hypothetical protein
MGLDYILVESLRFKLLVFWSVEGLLTPFAIYVILNYVHMAYNNNNFTVRKGMGSINLSNNVTFIHV